MAVAGGGAAHRSAGGFPALFCDLGCRPIWLHTTLYGKQRFWEVRLRHRFEVLPWARRIRVFSSEKEGDTVPTPVLNSARSKKVLAALEGNWQAEMEGYHTYTTLADRDTDPVRAQVLRHLAQAELEHATLWAGRIEE